VTPFVHFTHETALNLNVGLFFINEGEHQAANYTAPHQFAWDCSENLLPKFRLFWQNVDSHFMKNYRTRVGGLNAFQHRWWIALLQKFCNPLLRQKGVVCRCNVPDWLAKECFATTVLKPVVRPRGQIGIVDLNGVLGIDTDCRQRQCREAYGVVEGGHLTGYAASGGPGRVQ
jgi:hypothetical protein